MFFVFRCAVASLREANSICIPSRANPRECACHVQLPRGASFYRFMFFAFRCAVAPLREANTICIPSRANPRKCACHVQLPRGASFYRFMFFAFRCAARRCVRPIPFAYRHGRIHGNAPATCNFREGPHLPLHVFCFSLRRCAVASLREANTICIPSRANPRKCACHVQLPRGASFYRFMFFAFRCAVASLREANTICIPPQANPRKCACHVQLISRTFRRTGGQDKQAVRSIR